MSCSWYSSVCLVVGMVGGNSKNMDSGGEFSMVQEDFPALPGSIPSSNGQEQLKQPSVTSVPSEVIQVFLC